MYLLNVSLFRLCKNISVGEIKVTFNFELYIYIYMGPVCPFFFFGRSGIPQSIKRVIKRVKHTNACNPLQVKETFSYLILV